MVLYPELYWVISHYSVSLNPASLMYHIISINLGYSNFQIDTGVHIISYHIKTPIPIPSQQQPKLTMPSIFHHIPLYLGLLALLPTLIASTPQQSCNSNNNRPYSSRMANSVIARDQAIAPSHADTKEPKASVYLQVGFFQTAVLRLLEYYNAQAPTSETACVDVDRENWEEYLRASTDSLIPWLEDAKEDVDYPLDRFSTGRGLLAQYVPPLPPSTG